MKTKYRVMIKYKIYFNKKSGDVTYTYPCTEPNSKEFYSTQGILTVEI